LLQLSLSCNCKVWTDTPVSAMLSGGACWSPMVDTRSEEVWSRGLAVSHHGGSRAIDGLYLLVVVEQLMKVVPSLSLTGH
ncbi:hypothetical protein INR49_006884, partial [Caranx melampygus]